MSMLENAADETSTGSVINVDFHMRPPTNKDIKKFKTTISNSESLFMILVCKVNYENDFCLKTKLQDLSLESVFSAEPTEKQPLKLALITSKMICQGLYGDLTETEAGNFR